MREKSSTEKNIAPAIKCTAAWRVTDIEILANYQLKIRFVDGTEGLADLARFINSKTAGVFSVLADPGVFSQAYVALGAVTWPGEIDLAPDTMYLAIKKEGRYQPQALAH